MQMENANKLTWALQSSCHLLQLPLELLLTGLEPLNL